MRRNLFISYHHRSSYQYLKQLRELLSDPGIYDYGFKEDDLSEESKYYISKKIQNRIWSSSVTVVLIGEESGASSWIDWEIWYSLQKFSNSRIRRRSFNPKGLVALYLPVTSHKIPARLLANIESGYAVQLNWDEIHEMFYKKVEQAYANRTKLSLIKNDIKPMLNPQTFSSIHRLAEKIKSWIR